jgi:hypothetical protein
VPTRILAIEIFTSTPNGHFIDWLLGEQSIIDISNIHTLDTDRYHGEDRVARLVSIGSCLKYITIRDLGTKTLGKRHFLFLHEIVDLICLHIDSLPTPSHAIQISKR